MSLLDDMREVFGRHSSFLILRQNTTNTDELQAAKELILTWKENIAKFDSELFAKGVLSGNSGLCTATEKTSSTRRPKRSSEDIDFFIPVEGSTLWIDSFVILKGQKYR